MYRPGALLLGLPISATLFLAGCGTPGQAVQPPPAVDAAVPATPASLAAVAAEYVGEPASASENSNWAQAFGPRPLEAELLFGSTGEYDGDAVQVIVGKGLHEDISDCAHLPYQVGGCEDLADGFWYWGEAEPEEDPGGIFVVQRKGPVTVRVSYYGPTITGDPREQETPIEVQTLIDLAGDPRVDLTTDQDAVDQGADASYWQS